MFRNTPPDPHQATWIAISKEIKNSIINESRLAQDILFVREEISPPTLDSLKNLGLIIFLCDVPQCNEVNEDIWSYQNTYRKVLLRISHKSFQGGCIALENNLMGKETFFSTGCDLVVSKSPWTVQRKDSSKSLYLHLVTLKVLTGRKRCHGPSSLLISGLT